MSRALATTLLIFLGGFLPAQALRTLPPETPRDQRVFREVVRRLQGIRMDVRWEGVSLEDAISLLRARTGLNMLVAREAEDLVEGTTVEMTLHRVTALTLMKILAENHEILFQNRRGVIFVTTPEDARRRSLTLAIFDVRDLLYTPPDFPAPDLLGIRVGAPGGGLGGFGEEEFASGPEGRDPDRLVDIVRMATGEKAWDGGGVSLRYMGGRLVVRHTPSMLRKVARILASLRGVY